MLCPKRHFCWLWASFNSSKSYLPFILAKGVNLKISAFISPAAEDWINNTSLTELLELQKLSQMPVLSICFGKWKHSLFMELCSISWRAISFLADHIIILWGMGFANAGYWSKPPHTKKLGWLIRISFNFFFLSDPFFHKFLWIIDMLMHVHECKRASIFFRLFHYDFH